MAMLLDAVNAKRHARIFTVEDPIEFLYPHRNSFVDQLERGAAFETPEQAATRVSDANPDVIGWDLPKNAPAELVQAARSGALVFATMLAADAQDAREQLGSHARLIAGHIHVECPYDKQGNRVLKATVIPVG